MQVTSGFPTASGRRYGSFACGAGRTKGAAICGNKLTVADSKLSRAVLGALSGLLTSPAAVDHFVMKFGEHLSRNHKAVGSKGRTQLDRRIDEARTCARNLGEAIGKYGMSETLGEQLRDAEALLKRLREERAKTVTVSDRSQTPPSRERVVSYLADLTNTLKADSSRGNGLLAKHVGHITMTPVHEDKRRFYRATGAFSLSEDQVSIDLPGTLDNRGCASAQCS